MSRFAIVHIALAEEHDPRPFIPHLPGLQDPGTPRAPRGVIT
jgi:hypothetical protein